MIYTKNVDNENERESIILDLDLKDEDKKQSMTSKQFVLAFLLIFGNVFISIGFSIIATFLPKTASEIKVSETQIGFIFSVFGLSTLMLSPLIGKIGLNAAAYGIGVSLGPFIGGALYDFGFTPTLAGTMYIGYQVVYVISCPIVGRIVDETHTEKKCMVIGSLLLMTVCILIGPAPFLHIPETLWLTEVCLALVAITQAMSYIPSYKVLHKIALENGFPDNIHTTSKVSGIYLTAMGMGLFGGPSIGGIIIDHYSYGWACTIIGFCCGLSVSEKLYLSSGK
ncbi:MFS-type transporter SLC18B1 [Nymphon striatum]|nr:MFS-type transporter SLC18B1 [Nymphon striatum]